MYNLFAEPKAVYKHVLAVTIRGGRTLTHPISHGIRVTPLNSHPTMASESSQSTTIPSFSIPITEKLSKANYRLWRAQMEELLTGVEKMPIKTVSVQSAVGASQFVHT
jgi:hypothetical protein